MYEEYIEKLKGMQKKTNPNLEYFRVIHSKIGNYISQLNKLEIMNFLDYPNVFPLTDKENKSGIYDGKPELKIRKDLKTLSGELNYIIEKHVKPREKELSEWEYIDKLSKLQTRVSTMPNVGSGNEHMSTSILSNKINRVKEKLQKLPFDLVFEDFPDITPEQLYESFVVEVDKLEARIKQWIEERS